MCGSASRPTPPANRHAFASAGWCALELLDHPELDEHWDRPSILPGWSVGGLAGHLTRGVTTVERYLDEPGDAVDAVRRDVVDAPGYTLAALPTEALAVDSEIARAIRDRGDETATIGRSALVEKTRTSLVTLVERLEHESAGRLLHVFDGIVISLDDYLATRIVELVVHVDDLAGSIGVPADIPGDAVDVAADVLIALARRRRTGLELVRALARHERTVGVALAL